MAHVACARLALANGDVTLSACSSPSVSSESSDPTRCARAVTVPPSESITFVGAPAESTATESTRTESTRTDRRRLTPAGERGWRATRTQSRRACRGRRHASRAPRGADRSRRRRHDDALGYDTRVRQRHARERRFDRDARDGAAKVRQRRRAAERRERRAGEIDVDIGGSLPAGIFARPDAARGSTSCTLPVACMATPDASLP